MSRSLLLDAPLGVVASFGYVIMLTKVGVKERKLVVQSCSNLILVSEGFEALSSRYHFLQLVPFGLDE